MLMANSCINIKSVEYQTLKDMSGLSDFSLKTYINSFNEKHGRWPELDEIPNANSEDNLKHALHCREYQGHNLVTNEDICRSTGSSTVKEAIIKTNNKYKDLLVRATEFSDSSILEIKHRPTPWSGIYEGGKTISQEVTPERNAGVIVSMLGTLADLHGINFKPITTSELSTSDWSHIAKDVHSVNGFVYNGDVYINIDNLSLDTPIHEMLHLVLGSVRYSDPKTYYNLIQVMNQVPGKEYFNELYPNRTESDLLEEMLVSEFARYITGSNSLLSQLDPVLLDKLEYNMMRTLDTMLFGDQSVRTMNLNQLFNSSLLELAGKLGSEELENTYSGSFDVRGAQVHRVLANVKESLLRSGDLKEFCS